MRIALVLAALPSLAFADDTVDHPQRAEFLDYLGGQGCTLSFDSVEGAETAGIAREDIQEIAAAALESGDATEQGAYIVFSQDVCSIRMPEITSKYSVDDPVIRAGAPYINETREFGDVIETFEGCFIEDATTMFAELEDYDPRAGFGAFIDFMGASLISGDVRFYTTSPLKSPRGFQIVSGEQCSKAPNVQMINESHPYLLDGFAEYVRFVGKVTQCGDPIGFEAGPFTAEMQGYDHSLDVTEQPPINAWLDFEFLFITMAAGWHEGMTDVDRGTPRPPLCHYPN